VTRATVLASAKREAVEVRFPSSRAVALSEVALRMEGLDTEVARALWQQAEFEAVSPRDELDRVLARTSVCIRLVRSGVMRDKTAAFILDVYKSCGALKVARDQAMGFRRLAPLIRATSPALWPEAVAKAAEAARLIPEAIVRGTSYAELALSVAPFDAKLARQMSAEGEKAWRLADPSDERNLAAAELSQAWAAVDWEHAVDFSLALPDEPSKAQALRAAAEELAGHDLDKALVAVQRTPGPELRAVALAAVSGPAAAKRPDLADMLAEQAIASVAGSAPAVRDLVVEAAAPAIAFTDPDRALALVKSITDEDLRASATIAVATAVSQKDAARALAILKPLDRPELVEPALPEILGRLAAKDPAAALTQAQTILERYLRVLALCRIFDALPVPAATPAPAPSPKPAGG
jgi:hypothetical protein